MNFIKKFPIVPPIRRGVWADYDKMDAAAKKAGYESVEIRDDETIESIGRVGMQNRHLHCGWIATMDDYDIKALDQIALMNEKIVECQRVGEKVMVGFAQTGNFSVGYTIYRRAEQ